MASRDVFTTGRFVHELQQLDLRPPVTIDLVSARIGIKSSDIIPIGS